MNKPKQLRIISGGPWSLPKTMIQVHYEDPMHPLAKRLRETYGLDALAADATDELDLFYRLQDWVKRHMVCHGWSFQLLKQRAVNALDILAHVERGVRFHCYYHAKVFCQCCEALGYPARIVGARMDHMECPPEELHGNNAHEIAEVWSNTLRKWILIDCDINGHYERDGVPLSISELSDAAPCPEGIRLVLGEYQPDTDNTLDEAGFVLGTNMKPEDAKGTMARFIKFDVLDYYQCVLAAGRHDVFSHPEAKPDYISYGPRGKYPILYSDGAPYYDESVWTDDVRAFDWSVNETSLSLRVKGADQAAATWQWSSMDAPVECDCRTLVVGLSHTMPNFQTFCCRVDEDKAWATCKSGWEWRLHEGVNRLEVAAINSMGIRGPSAFAEVLLAF
ncbi:transglutaminase-like domain-containing protein [Eubacteriales bacterium OttesenSCG-928-K08]|nr:transglutaminase-like domain-containing protein [Eubacteriales bacterium OttesenSCG-928-K08]